ncbi:MAG TPA: mechanosensitive ion channel domain-containing protein [Bryobacteraceae bacterium]|jgi:small-conductance mechanosensitive channel|nr:mechanosensitive ion channel domain-containing protein [Bryobacteraceae bacterium]
MVHRVSSAFLLVPISVLLLLPAASTLDQTSVLRYLNQVIHWYRDVTSVERSAGSPDTLIAQDSVARNSKKIGQLAFDFARAEAKILGKSGQAGKEAAVAGNLTQAAANAAGRVNRLQTQLDDIQRQIDRSPPAKRAQLASQRNTLGAELNLAKEYQATVQNILSFSAGPGGANGVQAGFLGQVNELNYSIPELTTPNPVKANATVPASKQQPFRPESSGIVGLGERLFTAFRSRQQVDSLIKDTNALAQATKQMEAPLRDSLNGLIEQGDQVANAALNAAPTTGGSTAPQDRLNQLAAQFKPLSAAAIPLGEAGITLQADLGNIEQWRNELEQQYDAALSYFVIRTVVLIIWIVIILALAEVWKRATFRLVHETRRRRHILLLRRFVVGAFLTLAVGISAFTTSGFGSLATVAGLITAGLAVALQSIILSVVAYFFLMGRYGITVGDRITVSNVTGEVVDMGLTRIYMLEMAGAGMDLHSTGRIVVVSNAMLFQPSAWFKQAPGTEYTWHAVSTTFDPGVGFEAARDRLLSALNAVYQQYRAAIEKQHATFERTTSLETTPPRPAARVRFNDNGLEIWIRYPVEIANSAETDDQITRRLMEEIEKEPKLKLAPSGAPKISAA